MHTIKSLALALAKHDPNTRACIHTQASIVFYRDGVGEGQFDAVMQWEGVCVLCVCCCFPPILANTA